jgi:predicted CopG family antitoxin
MAQAQLQAPAHITTIQLHDDVIRLLNSLKKELKVNTYEEVIRALLKSHKSFKKSYFGAFPELKKFNRDEEVDDRLG